MFEGLQGAPCVIVVVSHFEAITVVVLVVGAVIIVVVMKVVVISCGCRVGIGGSVSGTVVIVTSLPVRSSASCLIAQLRAFVSWKVHHRHCLVVALWEIQPLIPSAAVHQYFGHGGCAWLSRPALWKQT